MRAEKIAIQLTAQTGRGVFATETIAQGEIIEICPAIVLDEKDRARIDKTALYNYYFSWGSDNKQAAIAQGYGSLYNHSYTPNAHYEKDFTQGTVRFIALKDITTGEEICTNYNGTPNDTSPLWFTPII